MIKILPNFRIDSPMLLAGILASIATSWAADDIDASFRSDWARNSHWIGPEYWANPLQDWSRENGHVVGLAGQDRTLHLLTRQVEQKDGEFKMEIQLRLDNQSSEAASDQRMLGGFRLGIRGELDDYRHALVHPVAWIDAGVRGDGKLVLGETVSSEALSPAQWVQLRLVASLEDGQATLQLVGQEAQGELSVRLEATFRADKLRGNLALLSSGAEKTPDAGSGAKWRFRDWSASGSALSERPENRFGPILWTQYTLSQQVMKLTALMAPIEDLNEPIRLEIDSGDGWRQVAEAKVDPLSRTATFRIEDWDGTADVPYRVVYRWKGTDHTWSGSVRRDPIDPDVFTVAAFSCDHGYVFPNSRITSNVAIQDPDLLFFAGDQIYEGYGSFGITRSPVDVAALDYLRKFWQFGWSWRELLKDRPSVILTDDHDVYQGNIWGHGGRRIPDMSDPVTGGDFAKGGYAMSPDWVNAVQRTQTAHLPDPVDPKPVEQGIGVYFTELRYGGLSFAILEDRKWKSGPASEVETSEAELLGPRQEAFLERWMSQGDHSDPRLVLSQTIFCQITTHAGRDLRPITSSVDSNAWPPSKRNRALRILSEGNVIMVHGDQHLGALVHQGVENWEDGPLAFMVPGTANGFPRAWWPDEPGENRQQGEPKWSGHYFDALGNRMTVLAVANPEKGSNLIPKGAQDPESIAHQKGSGYGLLKFDRTKREVTFEMWRLKYDANDPKPGDQFEGFPRTQKY